MDVVMAEDEEECRVIEPEYDLSVGNYRDNKPVSTSVLGKRSYNKLSVKD